MLRAKIHRARVTGRHIEYEGSLTVDRDLLAAVDIKPMEQVQIYNISNGERFVTYAIEGEAGSGVICANGAAARLVELDDLIIICAFGIYEDADLAGYKPSIAQVDEANRLVKLI
jgi:aspartate 1-decarboxylase